MPPIPRGSSATAYGRKVCALASAVDPHRRHRAIPSPLDRAADPPHFRQLPDKGGTRGGTDKIKCAKNLGNARFSTLLYASAGSANLFSKLAQITLFLLPRLGEALGKQRGESTRLDTRQPSGRASSAVGAGAAG
jgi:hypothetical protein